MTKEKYFLLFIFVLICFGQVYSQEINSAQIKLTKEQIKDLAADTENRVGSILKKEINLPGLAVAIVGRDEVILSKAFGYCDKSHRKPADTNTLYSLMSISKTMLAAGMMIAVQEGLVDLDVPIKTYLPEFHIKSRFKEDPMQSITIRHMLNMTSGLTHDAPVGNNADPYTPSNETHIKSISDSWLRFKTGERYEYSNLGIELASYILEKVTHKPFTEFINKKLFIPVGMKRSTYDIEKAVNDENIAPGYNNNFDVVPVNNPYFAAGGVFTCISDMAGYLKFLLNDGKVNGVSIINENLIKQMRTIPFAKEGQVEGYGMGLFMGYYHLGGQDVRWFAHGGGGFGYQCQMKWLPGLGYGVVVLTNSSDQDYGQERIAEDILQKIIEMLAGKKNKGAGEWLKNHLPAKSVDSAYVPSHLVGRYNGTDNDFTLLIKDGKFGYANGNSFEPMTPISDHEVMTSRYIYRFILDENSKPIAMVRSYNGQVWLKGKSGTDEKGPDKKEWQQYTGSYVRKRFGVGEKFYNVSIKNGWLHFAGQGQDFSLNEHLPGLFFTPDGEAIDLRSAAPTFRNIKLYKECNK